jgi:hypothetical protein
MVDTYPPQCSSSPRAASDLEVENDSSYSSVKLTWKHMKKNQPKSSELLMLKMMMIEVTTFVSLNHQ